MAVNNGEIRITVREDHTGISKQYVDRKVEQEATARQEADSALRSELTALVEQEATARQNAITAETTAREASEGTLSARITANTGAIEAVGDRVTTEAGTRASEDARIEAVVEANRQATANTFASVNQTIADNDIACQQRVATVNEKVDQKAAESAAFVLAERQAREASEALIRSYVDTKTAGALHYKGTVATVANLPQTGQVTGDMYNVQADGQNYAWDGSRWDSMGALIDLDPLWAGINANTTAISEEVANRQSAVSGVQNNLNTEITNRQAAVSAVQGNIDTETTNRQSAVSGVHNEVVAETNRATAAESSLQTAIAEEATNRQADVENLESQISAKTSAEIAADFEAVKAKLNAVADRTETGGYWVFAFTDANGNVTFGQTITGDLINGIAI